MISIAVWGPQRTRRACRRQAWWMMEVWTIPTKWCVSARTCGVYYPSVSLGIALLVPRVCVCVRPWQLLDRVYEFIQSRNPALANRETKRLKPPKVERVGSTRSCWVNFDEICSSLQRNPDHVKDFYLTELNTTGSVDGKKQMIIKGKYPAKQIESLLRKYISEYVMCENCRSLETTLSRDAETRLFFISCHACGASRSVSAIRGGFKAVRKGERRRARIK